MAQVVKPNVRQLRCDGNLGGVAVGNGINDAGIIVGRSGTGGTCYDHGFIYRDGVMTDLNDLIPPGSGLTIVTAQGINNAGQIVGVAAQDGDVHSHAILLTPDDGSAPHGSPDRGLLTALASLGGAGPAAAGGLTPRIPLSGFSIEFPFFA